MEEDGQQERALGEMVKNTPVDQFLNSLWELHEKFVSAQRSPSGQRVSRQPPPLPEIPDDVEYVYTVGQIQLNALRRLRQYTAQEHIIDLTDQALDLKVHIEVLNRIQE